MYPSYPSAGQGQPMARPEPPRSIISAVRLMYVGAALSAVSFVVVLLTLSSLRSTIRANNPELTTTQVNTAVSFGIVIGVIFGLIGIGLWIWMARANRGGRSWARVVATVFFGLNTLGLLSSFARPSTGISMVFEIIVWLVGLGAIIMLWNKESSAYYQAVSGQPRY
jgi:hypothetical protein